MKGFFPTICIVFFSFLSVVGADNDASMTPHAENAVIPVYQDNRLQFVIFSKNLVRHGNMSDATDPIIDILRRDAKISKLHSLNGLKPYALGASIQELVRFWAAHPNSDGLVFSKQAEIDQTNQGAMGDGEIFFRSPLLDLNGVGYTVDYRTKIININSKVRIVIRSGYRDPVDLVARGVAKQAPERVNATCDRMRIDFNQNRITLSGNVKVREDRFDLDADEMLIFFGSKNASGANVGAAGNGGISKIICNGNVKITRRLTPAEARAGGSQYATGDQGLYLVKEDQFELHGRAVLHRGRDKISADHMKLFRQMEQAELKNRCRFELYDSNAPDKKKPTIIQSKDGNLDYIANIAHLIGNVRIDDPAGELDCRKMTLHFRDVIKEYDSGDPVEKVPAQADPNEKTAIPELKGSASGGSKRLYRIDCTGDVHAMDSRGELLSEDMTIHLADPDKTPRHAGNARGDSKSGVERIVCTGKVRLENRPDANDATRKFVLTSDSGEVRMFENTAAFRKDVRVRDSRMSMTCDEAYLYARDLPPGTAPVTVRNEDDPVPKRIGIGDSRELKYVVAKNTVHVKRYNERAELQEAFGERGVYEVAKRTVTLTGTAKKRPILRQEKNDMVCDAVIMHLDSEEVEVKNGQINNVKADLI